MQDIIRNKQHISWCTLGLWRNRYSLMGFMRILLQKQNMADLAQLAVSVSICAIWVCQMCCGLRWVWPNGFFMFWLFDTCPASRCWFSHSFQMHEPHTGIRHCTICTRLQDGRQAMSSLDKVVNKICLFFCLSSSYVTILIHFLSFILDERIYWTFVSFFFSSGAWSTKKCGNIGITEN